MNHSRTKTTVVLHQRSAVPTWWCLSQRNHRQNRRTDMWGRPQKRVQWGKNEEVEAVREDERMTPTINGKHMVEVYIVTNKECQLILYSSDHWLSDPFELLYHPCYQCLALLKCKVTFYWYYRTCVYPIPSRPSLSVSPAFPIPSITFSPRTAYSVDVTVAIALSVSLIRPSVCP